MIIEPFGKLKFNNDEKVWSGLVDNISPENKVEINLYVDHPNQNLDEKLRLLQEFANDYAIIVSNLYNLICRKYENTEFELPKNEIEKMYFLSAIDLKKDNLTWWLTLEPNYNVKSIYNHFLRFTMLDRKVIWVNFDINTTT